MLHDRTSSIGGVHLREPLHHLHELHDVGVRAFLLVLGMEFRRLALEIFRLGFLLREARVLESLSIIPAIPKFRPDPPATHKIMHLDKSWRIAPAWGGFVVKVWPLSLTPSNLKVGWGWC